jgi:hypothetical protein
MVINKELLPFLVRFTAMNATMNVRYSTKGYKRSFTAREDFIKEVIKRYKIDVGFEDYLYAFFPLNGDDSWKSKHMPLSPDEDRKLEETHRTSSSTSIAEDTTVSDTSTTTHHHPTTTPVATPAKSTPPPATSPPVVPTRNIPVAKPTTDTVEPQKKEEPKPQPVAVPVATPKPAPPKEEEKKPTAAVATPKPTPPKEEEKKHTPAVATPTTATPAANTEDKEEKKKGIKRENYIR